MPLMPKSAEIKQQMKVLWNPWYKVRKPFGEVVILHNEIFHKDKSCQTLPKKMQPCLHIKHYGTNYCKITGKHCHRFSQCAKYSNITCTLDLWYIVLGNFSVSCMVYSHSCQIRTPLLVNNSVLIREVSFVEGEHTMHSQYLLVRIWKVFSLETVLVIEEPLYYKLYSVFYAVQLMPVNWTFTWKFRQCFW